VKNANFPKIKDLFINFTYRGTVGFKDKIVTIS